MELFDFFFEPQCCDLHRAPQLSLYWVSSGSQKKAQGKSQFSMKEKRETGSFQRGKGKGKSNGLNLQVSKFL